MKTIGLNIKTDISITNITRFFNTKNTLRYCFLALFFFFILGFNTRLYSQVKIESANQDTILNAGGTLYYCDTDGDDLLTGINPTDKTFTGPGITDLGPGSAIFSPSTAGVGNHTIKYNNQNFSFIVSTEIPATLDPFDPDTYCEIDAAFALTGGSPNDPTGTYYIEGVEKVDFDPAVEGPGTHYITYSVGSGGCISYSDPQPITVDAMPVVTLNPFTDVCEGDAAFSLSGGSPAGGTYSGTGVVAGEFDPAVAGVGTHTITYTYTSGTCTNSDSETITVNPLPNASFSGLDPKYCSYDGDVPLTGSPQDANGVFTGPGITDNGDGTAIFSPTDAGLGTHTIIYTYTDANSCSDSYSQDVQVGVNVTMSGLADSYCIDNPTVEIISDPSGGSYTVIPGLTDNGDGTATFDPSVAGAGNHTIEYVYNDGLCINTVTKDVEIFALPTVNFVGLSAQYCLNESPDTLTGNYSGGTFTGLGVIDLGGGIAVFDPASAGVGGPIDITYSYTNTNGCSGSMTKQTSVVKIPTATISGDAAICEGSTTPIEIALTGLSPFDFVYTDGSTSFNETGIAGPDFTTDVSPITDKTYTVTSVTDANGCTNTGTGSAAITVNPQVSVTKHPVDKTVCPGKNVSFSVEANGVDLTYQWQKDGADIVGATNAVLTLSNVDAIDIASYQCIVSSATCGGPVTSNSADLNLYEETIITTQPVDDHLCTGDELQLIIGATGSNLTFQWKKDGVGLTEGGDISGSTTNTLIITNVTTVNSGEYTCEVSGSCGTLESDPATVQIDAPIVITSQPTNKTGCPGDNVSFTVTATGTDLNFQWQKGGVDLPGETSQSLILNGISDTDAGNYKCVISSGCGASLSTNTVTLTVNAETQIVSDPIDAIVCIGAEANFMVDATGSDLNYQWIKDGNPLVDGGNITGSQADKLIISNADLTDTGEYKCEVSGSCGILESLPAELVVDDDINIITQPVSQDACEGNNISFNVEGTGLNLTYQWQKDGVDLGGETNNFLNINSITNADEGSYRCVISNSCGETLNSNTVTLTVNDVTSITTQPNSRVECIGNNVNFTVAADGTNLIYQWYKDSNPLADGGTISGAKTENLVISGADVSDAGDYFCEIIGDCGTVESDIAELIVDDNIVITTQPSSKIVCEGTNTDFSITASGSNITYQWQKDGIDIPGATGSALTLNNVTSADVATYRCVLENSCGTIKNSQAADLNLYENVSISNQPVSDTICIGQDASFSVSASGSNLSYQWYKDGDLLSDGGNISGALTSSLVITSAVAADDGIYSCEISGPCNDEVSDPVRLKINENTIITKQPTSKNICPGGDATFSVVAEGTEISYQWQKDGVDIPGETNSGLIINDITSSDEGTYRCVVSGECETKITTGALLNVYQDVVIDNQPVDKEICDGESTGFSITASGSGLNYQWQYNGIDLVDGGNISGTTSANLEIDAAALTDAGFYICIVSGTCGEKTSESASLKVNESVVITSQPQNKTACPGDDKSFTVEATGTNLEYQWQKDGADIGGATNATFLLNDITDTDEGVYRCIVTGICDTVTSNGATLSVNKSVNITLQPVGTEVCEGQSAEFNLTATGTNLSYQWKHNGNDLTDDAFISGANTNTLSVSPTELGDAGVYHCQVSGLCDSQNSNSVNLTVNENITVTEQPSNVAACPAEDVSFSVNATGTNLTYQWQKDGVDLAGETNPGLTIVNVTDTDEGVYRCAISGECGSLNSNGASLIVDEEVTITSQPDPNVNICEGNNLNLTVDATGTDLVYQWRKDGTDLINGGNISGVNSKNLIITDVDESDDGIYYCIVSGTCANVTSDFSDVTIYPTTEIIQQPVDYTTIEGGDATFSVDVVGNNLMYQWQKDGVDLTDGAVVSGAKTNQLTLTGVTNTDEGAYRCVISGDCNDVNSNPANLIVNLTSIITTQPTDKEKCEGESTSFSISALGTGLTYQWKKDGVDLSDDGNISGSTSANLTINTTSLAHAGAYTCVVAGENSAPAILTVHENTQMITNPTAKTRCEGDNVLFTVDANGSNLTYQWQKDGINLFNGGTISGADNETLTISATNLTDEGNYRCIVTGVCGTVDSDPAYLTVNENTEIITQPTGNTICENESHIFTVVAKGDNLIYQWKKDGVNLSDGGNISGAATKNLEISNADVADAGSYTCTVSGDCVTQTSVIAQLFVQPGTTISLHPSDATRCEEEDVTFSVLSEGSNLSYQWQKDGVNLSDDAFISGSNTSNLSISDVNISDAGSYVCVVTGDCGLQNSLPAELSVNEKTLITLQPSGNDLCEGESITLSVDATGSNLTYQWRKGTSNLSDGGNISGATTANLSITNADITDAGNYYCIVSGSCGTESSSLANVKVKKQTQIITHPVNVESCETKDISFSVDAEGENITYQWQKDGVNLSDGGNISGSTASLLQMTAIDNTDEGAYRCIITGDCGIQNSDPAQLTVYDKTIITTQPADKILCEGEQISLNVTAVGTALIYQWKKDGVPLSNGGKISGATTSNLIINDAVLSDAGIYSCEVSGLCDSENSTPVTVDVTANTKISKQPQSKNTCEGDIAVLSVEASGENLTYQWQKDGVNLSDGGNIFGSLTSILTINNISSTDAGKYRCIVTGDCGVVNSEAANLTVNVYPDAAGVIIGTNQVCQGDNSVFYEVDAIANADYYIWNLPVGVNILSGDSTRVIEVSFDEGELGGDFTVQGENSCGLGVKSPILTVIANEVPIAKAGSDQSICIDSTILSAQDTGASVGSWSVISGPAVVQDINNPNSVVTNLRKGINTLVWTVEKNSCLSMDTVIITNNHVDVDAGVDVTICTEDHILDGSTVPIDATGNWSVITGSASFTDGNDPNTTAIGFASGINVLKWTVSKNGCSNYDTVVVDNQRPTEAYAGIDQSLCRDSAILAANNASIGTGIWSVVTGAATFNDNTDPKTIVKNLSQGDNILRWTISNGICSTIDEVTISNNQLQPNAGIDQVICDRTTTLDADEPVTGTGTWSVISGSAAFVNNNLHNTKVTGLAKGENKLAWSINNNGCISSDTVSIINDSPTQANAGVDQVITEDFTTLQGNIPGTGTGTWTLLSGSAVISDPGLYNTNVTDLAVGENVFRWTITNNSCISYDDVVITNYMSTTTDAGADQTICSNETTLDGNEPLFGFGEWSILQGSAIFENNSDPKTKVTGLAKGENILRWSVWENGWTHDEVIITNDSPTAANAGVDQSLCKDSTFLAGNDPIVGSGMWTVINGAGTFESITLYNSKVTHLARGENVFKWTITNKSCSSTDLVKIINDSPTKADAGEDIETCENSVTLNPNTPSVGEGEWSVLSGSANFDGNVAYNLATDTNILRYTIVNNTCKSYNDVQVVNNETSTPNAGANKVICTDSISLAANLPVVGDGVWTIQSGWADIEDPANPTTKVTNLSQGINVFRWTVSYNGCTKFDEVTINNAYVEATAGINQEICSESTVLEANNPGVGTGTWSVQGGSGSAKFDDINQPDTRVNGLDKGTNILRWTITNDICVSYDEVNITNNLPTEAFAGPDESLCDDNTILKGNEPIVGNGEWSVLSGSATISNPTNPESPVSGLSYGVNTLRWTISNGSCMSTDEVVLSNNSTENSNAGVDQNICSDSTLLYANNPSFGEGQWSVISGSATFYDNNDHKTKVKNLGKGDNVLRWMISNGTCLSSDEVLITNNSPTKAIAGADQTICGNTTTLQGNTPVVGTGIWSLVSGAAEFENETQNNTKVNGLNAGSNTLRWTIENNGCISFDDVVIYNDLPYVANAGEDFAVCNSSTPLYANDPDIGIGEWTVISGSGSFNDPSDYNATVSSLGFGANTLRWTITYDHCITYDEIVVTNNKIAVNAGSDQTVNESATLLAASNPSAGTGQWSVIGGAGVFNEVNNPITEVSGLGAGLNTFRWAVDVNGCISYDDVHVTYNVPPNASFVISASEGCPPLDIYFVNNSLDDLSFSWNFDDGTTSGDVTVKHTYTKPGNYRPSLTVESSNGEIVTRDTLITVFEQPEASFLIVDKQVYIPDEEAIFINTSTNANRYLWEFGDGATSEERDPKHQYSNEGLYDIILYSWSENNCFDSTIVSGGVEVIESGAIRFPNAFTPNQGGSSGGYYNPNDFSNDVFYPIGDGLAEYHLEIFNKWGILVFESRDVNIGWDGYYKGELLNEGVYVYKVTGTYNNGKPFKKVGTVLLLR